MEYMVDWSSDLPSVGTLTFHVQDFQHGGKNRYSRGFQTMGREGFQVCVAGLSVTPKSKNRNQKTDHCKQTLMKQICTARDQNNLKLQETLKINKLTPVTSFGKLTFFLCFGSRKILMLTFGSPRKSWKPLRYSVLLLGLLNLFLQWQKETREAIDKLYIHRLQGTQATILIRIILPP